MSVPSIPTSFDHHLYPEKDFNLNPDISGELGSKLSGGFTATHAGGINADLSGKLSTDNVLTLKGDAKDPVATDSKVEILNLPRFTLQDIKDMQKIRVRIPNYTNLCFKAFGVEMFSMCLSGESQIITQPYVPNPAELCEADDCCEADTRPFPEQNDVKKND